MKNTKYIIIASLLFILTILLFYNKVFLNEGGMTENKIATVNSVNAGFEISQKNIETLKEEKIKKDSTEKSEKKDYMQIHNESILIDTHNDFIWKVYDKGADLGIRNPNTHSDLPKFRDGGLDVQVFAVWIPMSKVKKSYQFTLSQIDKLKNFETEYSSEFEFAKSYDDIIRITDGKKICGLIGIEGGTAIGNDLDKINSFFEMGVRYIGLTWNNSNLISTSAMDETTKGNNAGLSEFGVSAIKRMNEVGMLVDVSHLSEQGFWDVMEISTSPIIASHSNCYALNPHYRNLSDEQIKAIAENGGYIGINFYDKFLIEKIPSGGASIEIVLDHIDHIKKYSRSRLYRNRLGF
jgi:membrane dipeptidase